MMTRSYGITGSTSCSQISNNISANMEYTSIDRYSSIHMTYRKAAAKSLALTSLLGIILLVISQWSEYVVVLELMDRNFMLMMNFQGSRFTDQFWYDYTQKIVWLPLAIISLWSSIKDYPKEKQEKLIFLVVTVTLVVFLDQLSSGVIKPLVARLRPSHDPAIAPMLHYVNG